jgi:hypothetical protein
LTIRRNHRINPGQPDPLWLPLSNYLRWNGTLERCRNSNKHGNL